MRAGVLVCRKEQNELVQMKDTKISDAAAGVHAAKDWVVDAYHTVVGELQTLTNWLIEDFWKGQVLPNLPEIGTWVLNAIADTGEHTSSSQS